MKIKPMIVGAALAVSTVAGAQDFRTYWSENDGSTWFVDGVKDEKICTLVSKNSESDLFEPYAKIFVLPSENAVFFAVPLVDYTKDIDMVVIVNEENKDRYVLKKGIGSMRFSVRYADFTDATNIIMKKIGIAASVFLCDDALKQVYNSHKFSFNIWNDYKETIFHFETEKTIKELLEK